MTTPEIRSRLLAILAVAGIVAFATGCSVR